jgi:predicted SpoU family rRNA methylase
MPIPDCLDTPIHDCPDTPFPDRPDTPFPDRPDTPFPDRPIAPSPDRPCMPILDTEDEPHDLGLFLPSDSDGDNAVPTKVARNTKPRPKAVVPPQPVSRLSEEPSSGEDDEGLKGGPFSVKEVEKIKAEYAAFDKRIVVLATEMGRSVRSIQKMGGRVSRVVNPRKTTAWNVFQSSYPSNTDESVSQADYTRNTVRPAYNELVQKHGGERSAEWAAESARMIMEHTEVKATISADIAKHGGEVAKVIASHKKAWQKDFKVLAGLGVHCELTVLADNACSPAAHAQNGQLFGTAEMESYYKSRRDFKSHVGDAYTFILAAKAGFREAEEHKTQVLRREREEAFKNPNKAKGKVSKMLIELFGEFACLTS